MSSTINIASEAFRRNAEINKALAAQPRERVARAALGGPESARARPIAREKLLPLERVERLPDPGAPFLQLSQLAAHRLYDGDAPRAGLICGIGQVANREVMIIANDATVKGGVYCLPLGLAGAFAVNRRRG